MPVVGRPPQMAPDGAPIHYERHRPEQTTLYRLVLPHAASFIAHTEASTGAELPRLIKDEFDAFLQMDVQVGGRPKALDQRDGTRCSADGVPDFIEAGASCSAHERVRWDLATPFLDPLGKKRPTPQSSGSRISQAVAKLNRCGNVPHALVTTAGRLLLGRARSPHPSRPKDLSHGVHALH